MVQIRKRKCPICGETFKIEHPNSKYCNSKCRLIARKRQIERDVQRHRQKYKKTTKEARYEAIAEASREHGSIIFEQYHIGCVKHIYRNIGDSGIVFTFDKVNREILKWVLNQNT